MKNYFIKLLVVIFILGLIPTGFIKAITDTHISAEVQILCTDGFGSWSGGSGTIIDSKGIILTNKHVVEGAYKNTCFIGFIKSIQQVPDFGTESNPNLAEVKYITNTNDMDAAVLYLYNPSNNKYPYIDIWNSNSNNLQLGEKIEVIGFPGIGGSTVTYTSGDFSGFGSSIDGTKNYIKATAMLEHGNSGGAAYNSKGQFIGIPTMVVSGKLNSLSYILSVNSIKTWLSGLLGVQYKDEVIQKQPIVIAPEANIQIQNDITPPYQKEFNIGFTGYNENGDWTYYINRYGDSKAAIYEFPKIRFQLQDFIDSKGIVKGYYYYFGENPLTIPKEAGKYIATTDLICDKYCNLIPEMFSVTAGKSYYFIVQAMDDAGNISNPLINFEYIYEKDNFKDIKSFDVKTSDNKLLGNLKYPTLDESPGCQAIQFCKEGRILDYTVNTIYTNQDSLILYPNYGYEIDGLTYYISYGDDRWWTDKARIGKATTDKFIKISNLHSKGTTNIFIKPYKDNVNSFFGKHFILQVIYKSSVSGITVSDGDYSSNGSIQYRAFLTFTPNNSKSSSATPSNTTLKGRILLQVESHGEAYYVYPVDNKRYYLGRPNDAFRIMRELGLGISEKDYNSFKGYAPNSLSGRIFLRVEANGEAYYVNPVDLKMHYLGRPSDAFELMRKLGLGITNSDINKIDISE